MPNIIHKISLTNQQTILDQARHAIQQGKLIAFPTDTVYGLAGDAGNPTAIDSLYQLKQREHNKRLALLLPNLAIAQTIGVFHTQALNLARQHWPGALTLIVPLNKEKAAPFLADSILNSYDTIAIRIPQHLFALELLQHLQPRIIFASSANISGQQDSCTAQQVQDHFASQVMVMDDGSTPKGVASTIIDTTHNRLTILRQGSIFIAK